MARTAREAASIVSLKVTLRRIRPPIWRRLLVPGKTTLGDLHETIQAAMGWEGHHLHVFDVAGRPYGDPHAVDDVADEGRLTVNGVLRTGVVRFTYTYDFGDNWDHTIAIEAKQPPVVGRSYPTCIAGKRHCPPEDCGGPWGYEQMLAAIADPSHPDRREWWIQATGEDFNPEAFSVDIANALISARFGRQ
jgi:hypothetical protein